VAVVGLGYEGDDGCARVEERPHLGVVLDGRARLAGGAEGHQLGVAEGDLLAGAAEELRVPGIGARPAALDEAHAELVQVTRDRELVGDGEVDALALRAVAQRGVEDVEGVAGAWFPGVRRHGVGSCRLGANDELSG
jgi:hypothetical protein